MNFIFDKLAELSNQYLDGDLTAIECADRMADLFQGGLPLPEYELRDFARLMSDLDKESKLEEE